MRKARKQGASSKSSGAALYLPPVSLKEPVSAGLKVEFGFTPHSERLNGRIAFLGLAALLLVELATVKSGKMAAIGSDLRILRFMLFFVSSKLWISYRTHYPFHNVYGDRKITSI